MHRPCMILCIKFDLNALCHAHSYHSTMTVPSTKGGRKLFSQSLLCSVALVGSLPMHVILEHMMNGCSQAAQVYRT